MAGIKRLNDRHKKAAKNLAAGMSITAALTDAGYAHNTARQGTEALEKSGKLREAYNLELERLQSLTVPTPEKRAALIRSKLLENVTNGKDEALGSLKLLAQDKEVNLITPENVQGVVVIQMTPELGKIVDALELPEVREE